MIDGHRNCSLTTYLSSASSRANFALEMINLVPMTHSRSGERREGGGEGEIMGTRLENDDRKKNS